MFLFQGHGTGVLFPNILSRVSRMACRFGMHDTRTGQNTQPSLLTLLRQLV